MECSFVKILVNNHLKSLKIFTARLSFINGLLETKKIDI